MHPRRPLSILLLLLVAALLFALLASCQKAPAPTVAAEEATQQAQPTETNTPAPPTATRTPLPTLPATWTPKPNSALIVNTPTITPTFTATINNRQTLAASTQLAEKSPCQKYEEAWQIRIENSWRSYWCWIDGDPISYYEYNLEYPAAWKLNTFGNRHPNMIFITGKPDIEVRLYQVYAYETTNYTGTLEDAPKTAAFCEKDGSCIPVMTKDELAQTTRTESRQLGIKKLLIVDGIDGKRSVRRYFFTVNYNTYTPKSVRLFVVKVYTSKPIQAVLSSEIEGEEPYAGLIKDVEDIITSIRPDTDRYATPWPTECTPCPKK